MMKQYTKPTIEITNFRANESIAAGSIFEYTEGGDTSVTLFEIQSGSWNTSGS